MMWRRLEDIYHSFVNLCKNTTNTTACYIFYDNSYESAYVSTYSVPFVYIKQQMTDTFFVLGNFLLKI